MTSNGGFIEFRERLAYFESRGRYEIYKLRGPYLGKYQFGIARLIDLELIDRNRKWFPPMNKERFLKNHELQEAAFVAHVARHLDAINRRYKKWFGKTIDDVVVTPSGLVAAAHLVGLGGLNQMLRSGTRPADANGTTALQYMEWMGGYDLPTDLPTTIDPALVY